MCIRDRCLPRGDQKSLQMLKVRNKSIDDNLIDKSIPNIIFHEGNISVESQQSVIDSTPNLKTEFIDISDGAFKREFGEIEIDNDTKGFGLGYRHMCHFWFIDFWKFVDDYQFVIRIDDDCAVKCSLDEVFRQITTVSIISGQWNGDHPSCTKGLNSFFRSCVPIDHDEEPGGPYSNFMALNLEKLRANSRFQRFLEAPNLTQNIYRYRWGDLPLWGKVCQYLVDGDYLIINGIKYFHGSHNQYINIAYNDKDYAHDQVMFNRKLKY